MIRFLLSISLIVFVTLTSFSQTRYWVASTPATWSSNNWAATSGGAPDGGGPPTGAEHARFDGNGLGNCSVYAAAYFADFRMDGSTFNGDFTGTINGVTFYDGAGGNTFNGSFTLRVFINNKG